MKSDFKKDEFIKYNDSLYQFVELVENSENLSAVISDINNGQKLVVNVNEISKFTDSTVNPGLKVKLNVYDILYKHPDFNKVFAKDWNKYVDIIELDNDIISCRVDCNGLYNIIHYDKFGFRIDNNTNERISDFVELYPDEYMTRWIDYDFTEKPFKEKLSLKEYIANRTGSWIFTNVCGYGFILIAKENEFVVAANGDRFHFDYNGLYHGSEKSGNVSENPISQMVMVHTSPDDFITWTDWFDKNRWRAIKGESFYYINEFINVDQGIENFQDNSNKLFEVGNYFKSSEEAEKYLAKIKEILKVKY